MCPCCWDEAWAPRQARFGPPWAWAGGPWQGGPWRGEAGPWTTGPRWWSRPRREDLEEAKRHLEARLAEVNDELSRESAGG